MRYTKSIFYTTYGDYKNCGQFFDYLLASFELVAFFDLKSHYSDPKKKTTLTIYRNGRFEEEKKFITLPASPPIFLVPLYHLYYFLNILGALLLAKFKFHITFDIFITSFSLWSLAGSVGRLLRCCKTVVLWSWDYYPIYKDNPYYFIQLLLQPFETLAISVADHSWYASPDNMTVRVRVGQIRQPSDKKHKVVHWGNGGNLTGPAESSLLNTGTLRIVYFGALHFEKGLSLVVDSAAEIAKLTRGKLDVIFIGRMTPYGKTLAERVFAEGTAKYIRFIDFMSLTQFSQIASESDLGLALFVPEIGGKINFSHYADPAKPRDYLAFGLPILTTTVPFIHEDIKKYNAGFVLKEYTKEELISAIKSYMANPKLYKEGAYSLSRVDRYNDYYSKQFDPIAQNN